ncbi:mitochondrial outer membrane protein porin 2-like protein [Tanacetum coccineum]
MLYAFTSSLCCESWGRIGYARALVEINADIDLKKEVIMVVLKEEGYTREVINVEYEWKPPYCIECKTFGHLSNTCLKNVEKADPINKTADVQGDGFTEVLYRKNKGKKAANNQPKTKPLYGYSSEGKKMKDHISASKTQWNEVLNSDEEVDEVLFPEGDKFGDQYDIRLKGCVRK